MLRLLLTLALLLWATTAQAQMTFVQADCDIGDLWVGDGLYDNVLGVAPTNGNLLVFVAGVADGGSGTADITGIDDSGTSTYTEEGDNQYAGAGSRTVIWGAIVAGTPTSTITSTLSTTAATSVNNYACVLEFSGASAIGAQPTSNADLTGVTSHPAGTVTPGTAHNVVVGGLLGSNRTWTMDANFTSVLTDTRRVVGYRIQTSAAGSNYTPTSSTTADSNVIAVAFDGSSAGGGGCPGMLLRGVCDE